MHVPNVFQQLLYSATDLENIQHTITITNAGPSNSTWGDAAWFDIDWITFEQEFQPPSDTKPSSSSSLPHALNTKTYSAGDADVLFFFPPADWAASTFVNDDRSLIIAQTAQTAGDFMTLDFTLPSSAGNGSIGVFGPLGPLCEGYLVSLSEIDPTPTLIVSLQNLPVHYDAEMVHEQLLFIYNDLIPGSSYKLAISNELTGGNTSACAIEYIKTWSLGAGSTLYTVPNNGPTQHPA